MLPQWVIEKKRDGLVLAEDEIRAFVDGYAREEIPDYQMAAFAMAVFFKGMTFDETAVITDAMMRSGELVDTSGLEWPTADKHSTGGIGDKVSLVLAPLAACCEVAVPMISGRGLGITGGTLDKMESIPGYRTDLALDEFLAVVRDCGCSIIGQTAELAPADRKLYALRDVTGTVPSIPLITASIMSKKLAEGAGALVLDVKWGRGAFMKTEALARELAGALVEVGHRMGRRMTALITDMNQPLGRTAGNAVEVIEACETLQGGGPADVRDISVALAAHMLLLTGRETDEQQACSRLEECLSSGRAFEKFKQMVSRQGGDAGALEEFSRLPCASEHAELCAPESGYVTLADANLVGRACLVLGAGRRRVNDRVDHAAGITALVKVGEQVDKDQPLAVLHAGRRQVLDEALALLADAFELGGEQPPTAPLLGEIVRPE